MADDETVKHTRELLAGFIDARLVDVTLVDVDARNEASPRNEVFLHFDNGQSLHFWIDEVEGFEILDKEA